MLAIAIVLGVAFGGVIWFGWREGLVQICLYYLLCWLAGGIEEEEDSEYYQEQ